MTAEHEVAHHLPADDRVGDMLRAKRESMGKSIADVVDTIRIQTRYMEALENSRLEDLPDTVYALGFVRTYSEYLGLDPGEMVAQFKEESQGIKTGTILTMPEPIEEAKVPTAAIFFVAIVLAAVGYGVWYFLADRDSVVSQVAPDVPASVASVAGQEASPPVVVLPAPAAGTTVTVESPTSAAPAAVAVTEGDTPPPAVESATAPTEPVAPVATIPPATDPPAPAIELAVVPPAPATQEPVESVTVTQPPPAPAPAEPETVSVDTATAPPIVEAPRDPRVYGLGNTDARVVITALEDAWVEVTDVDDARLFSRVLRKGDSYRAPNREGAKFVTGNAGGLSITVDGVTVPPLGPSGLVRRNVKLDPDLLKSGRAWP